METQNTLNTFLSKLYHAISLPSPDVVLFDDFIQAQDVAKKYRSSPKYCKIIIPTDVINQFFKPEPWGSYHLCINSYIRSLEYRFNFSLRTSTCKTPGIRDNIDFFWFTQNVVICSRKATQVTQDLVGRIHNENAPAIKFASGLELFVWKGTVIPKEWFEEGFLKAKEVLGLRNLELRNAACEILGWDKIIRQLRCTVIDEDPDPTIGTLLSTPIKFLGRSLRFLRVRCGTGRTFALLVPTTMTSARAANAWTYGLTSDTYKPEVRT